MNKESATISYDHDDPSLRTGDGGLTVWVLQKMVQAKQFKELDNLFNNGLTMNTLPVGYAAGAAAPVFGGDNKLIGEALDCLAGKHWRGKVFFTSNNRRVSQGRNRIRESLVRPNSPIVPMAKFDTMLLDGHPLAPAAKSNLVVLSYPDPQTRPYLQERLVAKIPVYDVQVAVKGKYGPVFIGKTWFGKYDEKGEFTASKSEVIAWYFLDFNDDALKEQREKHWDSAEEDLLDPIPHVDN
jgi:hypothetical protein